MKPLVDSLVFSGITLMMMLTLYCYIDDLPNGLKTNIKEIYRKGANLLKKN